MSDILIVESRVRELLKQAPNAKKVSAEAMAWVNSRVEAAVRECIEFGSLTPGGKFLPPSSKLAAQPAYSDPLSSTGLLSRSHRHGGRSRVRLELLRLSPVLLLRLSLRLIPILLSIIGSIRHRLVKTLVHDPGAANGTKRRARHQLATAT